MLVKLIRYCAARCGCGVAAAPRSSPGRLRSYSQVAASVPAALTPRAIGRGRTVHTHTQTRALTLRACAWHADRRRAPRSACIPRPEERAERSVERASEQGRLRTARRFGRGAVRTCVARTLWAAEQGQAGNPDVDDCADVVLLLPDQARPGDAPQRKRKRVTQGSIQIIERARTEYM